MISKDFPNIFLTQIWPKLSPNLGKKKIYSWSCKTINLVAYFRWKTPARYPEQELMTKSDGKHSTGMQKKSWLCTDCLCWKKLQLLTTYVHTYVWAAYKVIFHYFFLFFYMCDCLRMLVSNGVCICRASCVFMWVCVSVRCMYVYVNIYTHLYNCMWRLEDNLKCHSSKRTHILLKEGLSLTWK